MGAPLGNKFALGLTNSGRPPKYSDVEELNAKIEEYFTYCEGEFHLVKVNNVETKAWDRQPETITITGLALFLGFDSRQSLYDYKQKDEFAYSIKRAITIIEKNYENALMGQSPTGAIFALKNFGWKDKQETEITGKDGAALGFTVNIVKTLKDDSGS